MPASDVVEKFELRAKSGPAPKGTAAAHAAQVLNDRDYRFPTMHPFGVAFTAIKSFSSRQRIWPTSIPNNAIEPLAMTYLSQPDSAEAGRSFAHAAQVLNDRITLPYCLPGRLSAVDVMVHWNLRFLLQTKVGAKLERARRYYDGLTSTFDWTDY